MPYIKHQLHVSLNTCLDNTLIKDGCFRLNNQMMITMKYKTILNRTAAYLKSQILVTYSRLLIMFLKEITFPYIQP